MQVSFLFESSCCSFSRRATISSIIFKTLSKLTFFPRIASAMKSSSGRRECLACESAASASARCSRTVTVTCMKLELALGSVFLNNSKASSSFNTLIVSDNARSSSAVVTFWFASNSAVLVPQFFSKSARNLVSSAKAASVSVRSFFISIISTPSSPMRNVAVSMACVKDAISASLAFTSALNDLIASSSVAVASTAPLLIVSAICFRMPTISPLCGAYSSS
mmetsp:Transcript_111797/g.193814  ORF Transcript_111797/g.193814 Transcript_111797/m.193814 type:complete len:222 (-) Transcript_111797:656-1321(-)